MGIVPRRLMTRPSSRRQTPVIVASVSSNRNSFGLTGHILVAKDGRAWEVARGTPWEKGQVVNLWEEKHGTLPTWTPLWASHECEIPRQLRDVPKPALLELWKGYKTLQALQEV